MPTLPHALALGGARSQSLILNHVPADSPASPFFLSIIVQLMSKRKAQEKRSWHDESRGLALSECYDFCAKGFYLGIYNKCMLEVRVESTLKLYWDCADALAREMFIT